MKQPANIFRRLIGWLGWPGLVLLLLALGGVAAGLMRERNRHAPLPPGSSAATITNAPDIRQTVYLYQGTTEELRAFYANALAERGWRRCGDGGTPNCSNLPQLVGRDPTTIDVYRGTDDQNGQGPTVEIWRIPREGSLFVTVFETP
jgi:hypothetical protein